MYIDFDIEPTALKQLQVDDIGNVSLLCHSDSGLDYGLSLETRMGRTYEVKFGPVLEDRLQDGFALFYRELNFNETFLKREISQFINDRRKAIKDIDTVERAELEAILPKNFFTAGDDDGNQGF